MKSNRYFRMIRGAFVCGTAFLLMLLTCGLAACAGGASAGTESVDGGAERRVDGGELAVDLYAYRLKRALCRMLPE